MRRRIYTDTSVIGGCLDPEFALPSRHLLRRFAARLDVLVLSSITRLELQRAPEAVQRVLTASELEIEEVTFDDEAAVLSEQYLAAAVVGAASRADSQHIATESVHRVDLVVSWNFKHIVNLDRIRGFNSVNLRLGYPILEIRTPQEVLSDED